MGDACFNEGVLQLKVAETCNNNIHKNILDGNLE